MVNIDNWIPKYILGYLIYISFIVLIMSSATRISVNIYDLTTEQEAILTSQETDALTFLSKAFILSSVSSTFAVVSIITFVLSLIFLLALAKAIKEVIPVLPS